MSKPINGIFAVSFAPEVGGERDNIMYVSDWIIDASPDERLLIPDALEALRDGTACYVLPGMSGETVYPESLAAVVEHIMHHLPDDERREVLAAFTERLED